MSNFTKTPLILQPLSEYRRVRGERPKRKDAKAWVLQQAISYEVGEIGSEDFVHVAAGFVTDLASIPRPLWAVIAPFGLHAAAAVVHDYGYCEKARPKSAYDRIFREAMLVLGVRKSKAYAMWLAVYLFGWFAWWSKGDCVYKPLDDKLYTA